LRRNLALLALAAGMVWCAHTVIQVSLRPAELYSGWLLAGLMLVLACYNVFKKLPFLPLGASASWLQLHIYIGLLTILVFVLHSGARLPRGPLGWVLTALYIGVAGSGVPGLVISRVFPALLRARGPEVIFEQIPALRRRLREQAELLVLDAVTRFQATIIAEIYMRRLKWFFNGPRQFWRHVFRLPGRRHALLTEIDAQERYLNDEERATLRQLRALVERKDDLDFQHALQGMLKYWLMMHVPLTYSLLVFVVLHVLVVYAYL
jgi:hypothetical protein